MNRVKENESVIIRAFAEAQKRAVATLAEGFIKALKAGVETALHIHDERHQNHLKTGGSYGWALWYNGSLYASEIKTDGEKYTGNANEALQGVKPRRKYGFYGVVLAGMKGSYYIADYERDILTLTAEEIGNNFSTYFKSL